MRMAPRRTADHSRNSPISAVASRLAREIAASNGAPVARGFPATATQIFEGPGAIDWPPSLIGVTLSRRGSRSDWGATLMGSSLTELVPETPISPATAGTSPDKRLLGIGLKSLQLKGVRHPYDDVTVRDPVHTLGPAQ
jgi:hypothetical protein